MNPLVLLAKSAVENYIKKSEVITADAESVPKEFLDKKAGVFVTIEKHKGLRGCIGTYLPTRKNTAEEVIHNAISAATEDYRFGEIKENELPYLSYTVYVLNKPELANGIPELNPKKFGIIVKTVSDNKNRCKSALLLPDLDGIDTSEEQVSIACKKGGIDPKREEILIYKFTAEKLN